MTDVPSLPPGVAIREATTVTPALVEALAALIPQLSSSAQPPTHAELEAILASPATTLFVASDGAAIVGVLTPIRRNRGDQIIGEPHEIRTSEGTGRVSRRPIWGGWNLAVHPPELGPSAASRRFVAHAIFGLGLTLVLFRIPTGLRAIIEDVVVDQSRRGQRIGEALTLETLEHARAAGARTVDLTSRPSREAANRLYQRLGFVRRDSNVYRYPLK